MNNAPSENRIEEMLEAVQPRPGERLSSRMASAPWTRRGIARRRNTVLTAVVVLSLVLLIALSPQGRALAQALYGFFTTTGQKSFPLSPSEVNTQKAELTPAVTYVLPLVEVTAQPVPASAQDDCSDPVKAVLYPCQIATAEAELGFSLKQFVDIPKAYGFERAETNRELGMAAISYQLPPAPLGIILYQGFGDFPPSLVYAGAVEAVQVGQYPGEYAKGGFNYGSMQRTWDPSFAARLRWREGERWFEILEQNDTTNPDYLDKSALVALAAGMTYHPEQPVPVDTNNIRSVALAERVAGFDVREPAVLPEGFELDHASYDPDLKSVTLFYHGDSMKIIQTPLTSNWMTDLSSFDCKNIETVQVGNLTGQYSAACANLEFSPTGEPSRILLWQQDGMMYQIRYLPHAWTGFGGVLTRDQIIRIAESLR